MTDPKPLDAFSAFVAAVLARLEAGRHTYGDRSFSAEPAKLLEELEQEVLDLAGWGFIFWCRLQAMSEALGALPPVASPPGAPVTPAAQRAPAPPLTLVPPLTPSEQHFELHGGRPGSQRQAEWTYAASCRRPVDPTQDNSWMMGLQCGIRKRRKPPNGTPPAGNDVPDGAA